MSLTLACTSPRAMAMSERNLQRRLQAEGTSFAREVAAGQIRVAKRLLAESDVPVTTIAHEIGCSSPQHFSHLFRRMNGESPTRWRERNRRRS